MRGGDFWQGAAAGFVSSFAGSAAQGVGIHGWGMVGISSASGGVGAAIAGGKAEEILFGMVQGSGCTPGCHANLRSHSAIAISGRLPCCRSVPDFGNPRYGTRLYIQPARRIWQRDLCRHGTGSSGCTAARIHPLANQIRGRPCKLALSEPRTDWRAEICVRTAGASILHGRT